MQDLFDRTHSSPVCGKLKTIFCAFTVDTEPEIKIVSAAVQMLRDYLGYSSRFRWFMLFPKMSTGTAAACLTHRRPSHSVL